MVLPKHLRPRWRYLGVAVESPPGRSVPERRFQAALWEAARSLLGDPGSGDADLSVLRYRHDRRSGVGRAVVRVRRDEVETGRAAVACVTAVEDVPVGVRVAGVGGTVRACAEKYFNEPPEATDTDVVFGTERRSAVVRGDAVDLPDDDTFTSATPLDTEGD